MKIRRVVTGIDQQGKSTILHDGVPPRTKARVHTPGFEMSLAWVTKAGASDAQKDLTEEAASVVPAAGETSVHIVTFPPDSVMSSPHFNPTAAVQEHMRDAPGLIEFFEPDSPGMHKTPTTDYAIVLEGEIWLELDDGALTHLKPHDFVVQNATRHAWRNKSEKPALVAFILIGRSQT